MSCVTDLGEAKIVKIAPDDKDLVYSGRVEWRGKNPVFMYPCTSVTIHFKGTRCSARIKVERQFFNSYLGVIVDGKMNKFMVYEDLPEVMLVEGLEDGEHTVVVFKPQDSANCFTFLSFSLGRGGVLLKAVEKPSRRIKIYGDSVSAGEISEAVEYVGRLDPVHNGEYSNSYYSFGWIAARKLNAEIQDVAQGGISLLDGSGFFNAPDYLGMESCYDKTLYNPYFGEVTTWDFTRYTPHVVIVAIGQNDSYPEDYMKESYEGEKARNWRTHYQEFILTLRSKYPKALIVLQTTILNHDASWDKAIDQVCKEIADPKVVHFLYEKNGCGTPGHIRIPEAEQMAEELVSFLEGFGDSIWK